ncbi:ATP-dependent helicase C-terminal domain-containing protein [Marinobacterium aestuariivivens]|uniref:ATP-dependent helicase C-terminal domain-containing protein n=1 Tax=Marinobacterium aestuariivivens TaxID=1698799 RepID=A0ABW2A8C2_9GAMM
MVRLPAHPRIAHMLLEGCRLGLRSLACEVAALLSDRDPLRQDGADIATRLAWLRGESMIARQQRAQWQRLIQQRDQFRSLCDRLDIAAPPAPLVDPQSEQAQALLIACAYPDRIAVRKQSQGLDYRLASGRAARLAAQDPLRNSPWLALAQLTGRAGDATDRIVLAAPFDPALLQGPLRDLLRRQDSVAWSDADNRLVAERQTLIGQLVLSRTPLTEVPPEDRNRTLCALVRKRGLRLLPWTEGLERWRQRVAFLRRHGRDTDDSCHWPDLSDKALLESLDEWLTPWLDPVSHLNHFAALDLGAILQARLPWPLPQQLDEMAPEYYRLPSGHRARIDYSEDPPVLAVKLQELFGCRETPRVGQVALKLHLLSPAHRPLQVTQDLVSFWNNGYRDVQKDMKGRYPKHHWPDDPLQAAPGSGIKRRK